MKKPGEIGKSIVTDRPESASFQLKCIVGSLKNMPVRDDIRKGQ